MKFFGFLSILCSLFSFVHSEPPREVPPDLLDQFTISGQIPVLNFYMDNTASKGEFLITLADGSPASFYPKDRINIYVEKAKRKEPLHYGITDIWLYEALEQHPLYDKDVLIVGSTTPWYESIVIAYGGRPTTIDYNKIVTDDNRITTMTVAEFNQNPQKFDVILSISSIEHDGLGRYGDPINPTADLEFMAMAKEQLLKEDGAMILAVPVGRDCLHWNAARIYGPLRLALLFKGWKIVDTFGFSEEEFSGRLGHWDYQPIFYLAPGR